MFARPYAEACLKSIYFFWNGPAEGRFVQYSLNAPATSLFK